jgi:hypothetical protein
MATGSGVTSKSDKSLTEGPSKGSQLQKPQVEIVTQYPQVRLGPPDQGGGRKKLKMENQKILIPPELGIRGAFISCHGFR